MVKKLLNFAKNIGLYFSFAILLIIIGGWIYGVDESNTLQCPNYYLDVIFFLPFLCVFVVNKRKKIANIARKMIPVSKTDLPPVEPFEIQMAHQNERQTSTSFPAAPDPVFNSQKAQSETAAQTTSYHNVLSNIDLMDGHDFEYWAADLLRKLGFLNVFVTPGSGDHGVDVLAQKDGIQYAIQCKRYSHDLGNTPVQEVHAGKQMYGCQIGVVLTNKYFTPGAKHLADATGVLLWDRDWLIQKIQEAANTAPQARRTDDNLYQDAVKFVLDYRTASAAAIQRRFKIGYAQAARLIDKMEVDGYVGPYRGSTPREILK